MEKKDILKKVPDTLTQKGIQFDIEIDPRNFFHKWQQKKGYKPTKRYFHMKPFSLAQLENVSKLLLEIGFESFTPDDIVKLMANHARTAAKIIAISVTPSRETPSNELIDFLMHGVDKDELQGLVTFVTMQMDGLSFTKSILSLKSLNLLTERSLQKEEIIAPSTPGVSSAA